MDQQCAKLAKNPADVEPTMKAFQKLFDNGHMVYLKDLPEDTKEMFIHKDVQHYMCWRLVNNPKSVSTPVRPVMDASTKTPKGRCLNDLVVKGRISSLNLIRMVLRHTIGRHAVAGDLSQFYNSLKLREDFYNLQRFLFRKNLDISGEVLEAIIITLIYGVKSVSAQSEEAMLRLAKDIEDEFPALAKLLRIGRYVDDMGESKPTKQEIADLIRDAEIVFSRVKIICKGWTEDGKAPEDKISGGEQHIGVGGLHWVPQFDVVSVPVHPLHFGTVKRGRLDANVKLFNGSFGDLENFVPNPLSLRQVVSKVASIFDIRGLLAPIMGSLRLDSRKTCQLVDGWDQAMPDIMRKKWIENFWTIEKLRGLSFSRALMPENAINSKARMIVMVDAAQELLMINVYIGFEKDDQTWSCQLLIARPALADPSSTIPKNELQVLCSGSNLGWTVQKALEDWVTEKIVCSDSTIALHWTMAEQKPLGIFHKNRVLQIRRGTDTSALYHVRTEVNTADIGTRQDKISIKDVMPDSVFQTGYDWMRMNLSDAEEQGYITKAGNLRLKPEESRTYEEPFLFQKIPDILTHGHVISPERVDMIQARAEEACYLVLPTKHSFPAIVRIYAMVFKFVTTARKGQKILSQLLVEGKLYFQLFNATVPEFEQKERNVSEPKSVELKDMVLLEGKPVSRWSGKPAFKCLAMTISPQGEKRPHGTALLNTYSPGLIFEMKSSELADGKLKLTGSKWKDLFISTQTQRDEGSEPVITDRYINQALLYLYRKGSCEVKAFNKPKQIKKSCYEVEGVLLSRDRLLQGMDFIQTAELDLNLGAMGIKTSLPVLDRYSPLSYSIARYIHHDVAKHRGAETCTRLSLGHVHILQGGGLYRELGEQCLWCKIKRQKYLEAAYGPLKETQLTLAPPFHFAQMDLFGPIRVTVPGKERETRQGKAAEAAQCWIVTFVCPTTRLINMQVVETSLADGITSAVTRLGCEIGVPKKLYIDEDSAVICGLKNSTFDMRNLQAKLSQKKGIQFEICPVGGHNAHGQVERVIRSVQESFNDAGLQTLRLHATQLQTLAKLIENAYNSLPLGYHQSDRAGGNPILKIICPNHLRVGKLNNRALDGPMRLPSHREEQLKKVSDAYTAWFRIWQDVYLPQLLYKPKWFNTTKDLLEGDLVYFIKKEGKVDGKWMIGMVESIEKGRDGVIRQVEIKYCNAKEQKLSLTGDSSRDHTLPRYTERTVRKLVKIFSIEDASLEEDMAELRKKMDTMPVNFIDEDERAGLVSTVCCESHAELEVEVNSNNDPQAGNLNMITESIQLGELHEFTWDEVAAYYWDNANLWDQPELASDLE